MLEAEHAIQGQAHAESTDVHPHDSAWTRETNATKIQVSICHSGPTIHVDGDA